MLSGGDADGARVVIRCLEEFVRLVPAGRTQAKSKIADLEVVRETRAPVSHLRRRVHSSEHSLTSTAGVKKGP
jgi:hypothetical protein